MKHHLDDRPVLARPRRVSERSAAALLAALLVPAAFLGGCERGRESAAWSGYVEGEYVYIASPFGGALRRLAVQPGQTVARGAPLFELDADSERAARDEAAARLESAKAQAADTGKGRRADEIAVTQAQLAQARAQAMLASSELVRQQQLVAQGFISASRLDDARNTAEQGRARVAELQAALRVAQLPARSDERAAAAATTQAAADVLRQNEWRAQQKQQTAPADARVADTFFRVGEWVQAGQPVVALLPPGNIRARFYVPEAELGALALGDAVQVSCDGCGAPIAARISFIATQAEYTPPVIYSNAQRAKLVFRIDAKPEASLAERLKPGQPIDVRPLERAAASAPAAASR